MSRLLLTVIFLNEHNINADSSTVNNLLVKSDLTLLYVNKNSVLITDAKNKVVAKGLTDNQLLIGKTGDQPQAKTLTGTTNQVNINIDAGTITLSLPQDIDMTSSPEFDGLEITNNIIVGGLVDGVDISVFKADYDSKIDQGVKKTDSPSFNNLTVNNIDCSSIVSTGDIKTNTNIVGNQLIGIGLTSNRLVGIGVNGLLQSLTTNSNNGVTATVSGNIITINTPKNLQTNATPQFSGITTNSLSINGVAVTPSNYVTLNSNQTIASTKTFSQDITFGTLDFGQIRFSTYGEGRNRIASGWLNDADYFMEFYVHNVKAMEIRNGYSGSGRDREVTMPGLVRTGRIVPTTGRTHNIGSDTQPYRNLYLGNGTGDISLGHGIRTSGRAELHLHANGDNVSEIMFGTDARIDANVKWILSSRESGSNDLFRLFRGPKLTGGAFSQVLSVVGSGTDTGQFQFHTATDSSSTTTGSATFAGGVGIAKNLNAARVIVPRGTGAIDAKFVGAQPELFINSDGDGISQLSFRSGPAESTNTKWAISSRASGANNEGLRVYRGPKLAGGSWDQIIQIDGTGTDAGRVIFNKGDDATSTTSGAVQIRGGLGVAKTLHAKDIKCNTINTDTLTLTNNLTVSNLTVNNNLTTNALNFGGPGQSVLNHYEELWVNSIVFYCTVGTTTPSTLSADLRVVRIGLNVTLSVYFKGGLTPGLFSATNQTKMRSDIGLPQKFTGSRTPPTTTISVINNGNGYVGAEVYLTDGNLVIWAGPLGDFSGVCRIPSFSMSYNLFLDDF